MSELGATLVRVVNERDALRLANDRLRRQIDVLNAKLLELSSPQRNAELVRATYRRGYLTGYNAQRRGAGIDPEPERHARTWVREAVS